MPEMLKIPNLAYLKIDAVYVNEHSLGEIKLNSPKIRSFCLRCVDKADDVITIGEGCENLQTFELRGTLEKKVVVKAPSVKRIYIEGLKKYERLDITSMSAYTLHLSNTVVHLEGCPGVGRLII